MSKKTSVPFEETKEPDIVFVGYFSGTEVAMYRVLKKGHPLKGKVVTEQEAIINGLVIEEKQKMRY